MLSSAFPTIASLPPLALVIDYAPTSPGTGSKSGVIFKSEPTVAHPPGGPKLNVSQVPGSDFRHIVASFPTIPTIYGAAPIPKGHEISPAVKPLAQAASAFSNAIVSPASQFTISVPEIVVPVGESPTGNTN